ncbi:MAG: hypothetical protein UW46_C0006G0007 [Candidatus Yanofskybacteria bacterium GW2011_GWF1_44_227]|uniref:Uncharacterized protein n=1 Tax=Candidatus Yanofskybacteria bacterium GW2011_GWE2_40_11 TaxID=1619033 RepID=A0A0G0QUI1_9BACT|nr:MAG: hypothetical protein UT69_C0002G0002 [Candidatus Yanofskybacteria bacterium GW2011_GWE1_40_10]KKR41021.1 MAG: hypothetical protein UT75_C0002G0058 [Candidatus Yanofskybacteria bacterium GW2011_GWE2_40_11]KKT15478.1 MAG: hypothetical protein UV97_C0006G0045 [Candidatus Yanofskybacteria bacterium GW2011_GWF2_43_596]KKT53106.1 MAG: hypothetical protein UW46_C0006G0007 [Candidatus Yanofskybacteria bacterium GW2011_GWF1_44_227]
MHLDMNDRHGTHCTRLCEHADTLTAYSNIHIFCPKISLNTQDIQKDKAKASCDMVNVVFYSSPLTSENDQLDLEYHSRGICQYTCNNAVSSAYGTHSERWIGLVFTMI